MGWMTGKQQQQYNEVCELIDTVKTQEGFYRVCETLNSGIFDFDVVATAREAKRFYNSAQYM